jgi:hypothetical protein
MLTFVSLIWFEGWFIWAEGMVAGFVGGVIWLWVLCLFVVVGWMYLFEREKGFVRMSDAIIEFRVLPLASHRLMSLTRRGQESPMIMTTHKLLHSGLVA